MKIKKLFLIIMFFIISSTALLYGFSPLWFARMFLDTVLLDINFSHILRAVMGLYLGFGAFWLFAAFNNKYRNNAILTSIIFTTSVALGRIISIYIDGQPAPFFLGAPLVELILAMIGYWVFKLPE